MDRFPYDAKTIDALVLTHAHLDHVGRIPKLVKDGFRGKIYMTPPTRDLAELILRDSVNILRQDAERRGLAPLYEEQDVETALSLIETLDYHIEKEVCARSLVFICVTPATSSARQACVSSTKTERHACAHGRYRQLPLTITA